MTIRKIRFCDLCDKPIKGQLAPFKLGETVEVVTIHKTHAGIDLHPGCHERIKAVLQMLGVPEFESVIEADGVEVE